MTEKISLSLPNEDVMLIDLSVVKNVEIREPKHIGDTVFFWMNDTYVAASEEDFKKIIDVE